MLERNPFDKMKGVFLKEGGSRIRYLTTEEIKRLFVALNDIRYSYLKYLRPIVLTALLTGLRKQDILNLKWRDVDFDKGILFFFEHKKDRKTVKIFNSDMLALLKELPRGDSEYIFIGPHGGKPKDISRCFRSAVKRAGIKDFHFHDLRHTSASYMVMAGASLRAVQEHLGHTTLTMTQKYAHLSPEFQKAEVNRLNGVFHVQKDIDLTDERLTAANA